MSTHDRDRGYQQFTAQQRTYYIILEGATLVSIYPDELL